MLLLGRLCVSWIWQEYGAAVLIETIGGKSADAWRREMATPICVFAIRTRHLDINKLGMLAESGLTRGL